MQPENAAQSGRALPFPRSVVLILAVAGALAVVDAAHRARGPLPAGGIKASAVRKQLVQDHWAVSASEKRDGWSVTTYSSEFDSVHVTATVASHGCKVGMLSYTLTWDSSAPNEEYQEAFSYACESLFDLSAEAGEASERVASRAMSRAFSEEVFPGEATREETETPDGWIVQGSAVALAETQRLTRISVLRPDVPELAKPPGMLK